MSSSPEARTEALLEEIERCLGKVADAPKQLPERRDLCWSLGFSAALRLVRWRLKAMETARGPVIERTAAPARERIPCDVAVAPATVFAAGCDLSLVLAAIRQRRGVTPEPHFRRAVLQRVMPPGALADVAALIAREVAGLQDRKLPPDSMHVTFEELELIVRRRLSEEGLAAEYESKG